MTETLAILFIFFVLIFFGLILYFQFQRSSVEKQRVEILSEQAIDISLVASFLPELICSKGEHIPTKDCIDLYKLKYFQEKIEDEEDYYFDYFAFSKIYVEQIHPEVNHDIPLGEDNPIYDQEPAEWTRKNPTPINVVLYEPYKREFYFGVLNVEVYS